MSEEHVVTIAGIRYVVKDSRLVSVLHEPATAADPDPTPLSQEVPMEPDVSVHLTELRTQLALAMQEATARPAPAPRVKVPFAVTLGLGVAACVLGTRQVVRSTGAAAHAFTTSVAQGYRVGKLLQDKPELLALYLSLPPEEREHLMQQVGAR